MAETRWITLHLNTIPRRVRADAIVEYGSLIATGGWYCLIGANDEGQCDETMEQITALLDSPRSGATEEAPRG